MEKALADVLKFVDENTKTSEKKPFWPGVIFAFVLATIPAYHGYYMKGGALDVGKASTISFVWTSVAIIIIDFIITQILLT